MAAGDLRNDARSKSWAAPIHAMLGAFPFVCFIGALLTDIAYADSANLQWQYFSVWLLTAGLLMGALAAIAGIVETIALGRRRSNTGPRLHILLTSLAWLVSLVNVFVHSRDGWTAVVPEGLVLSGIAALLVLVGFWIGQTLPDPAMEARP